MFYLRLLLVTATLLMIPGLSGATELLSSDQNEVSCKSTSKDPYCVYPPVKTHKQRAPASLISKIHEKAAKIQVSEAGGVCVVKKGAAVSKIARDVCQGPLYKENGCLTLFLAQNPSLNNPDLIFPGQKLILPKTNRSSSQCEGQSENVAETDLKTPDPIVKSKSKILSNKNIHRADFDEEDNDYLHMDAVVAQLGDVKLPENNPAQLSPNEDYLEMDSVVSQLDPDLKSQAGSLVGQPPKTNVFSRLVIPDRVFLNPDGSLPVEKTNSVLADVTTDKSSEVASSETESTINNYCIVKKGASTSKIARDVCAGPLYEQAGCLEKFLALNPIVSDPDLIFPGQKLIIPPGDRRSSSCEGGVRPQRFPADVAAAAVAAPPTEAPVATPAPTPAITPAPTPIPTPIWKPHSDFSLGLEPSFTRIDSTDAFTSAKATLLSNLNLGVNTHWRQIWTKNTSTEILFDYVNTTISPISNRSFNNPTQGLFGFGIGAHTNLSDHFQLGGFVKSEQQIFLRATSVTSTNLDELAIPEIDAEGIYTVAEISPFKFDLVGRGTFYFPSTTDFYSVSPGWGYLIKGQLTQEFEKMKVQGGVGWQMQYQNTSIATQVETHLLFNFDLSMSF
jgi:LysM repeat protein